MPTTLELFKEISIKVLNKHAPIKKKSVRGNNGKFMTKELRLAIMNRSKLRNEYLKDLKNIDNKIAYNKQRNLCLKLLKKAKRNYFNNLDTKDIADNKKFWTVISPYFSGNMKLKEKITLIENKDLICEEKKVSDIFNTYFSDIVPNLNILPNEVSSENIEHEDPVQSAINKYASHSSIVAIKTKFLHNNFSFQPISIEKVNELIKNLDPRKSSQKDDIPIKIVKSNLDIFSNFLYHDFNNCIVDKTFPAVLKNSEVTPVFKKGDRTNKENYRPISILPNLSKIYEKCLFDQIYTYFDKILSKFQLGFRRGCSTQHCLLAMIEKWRKILDKGGVAGAVLTDLSKAFDCLQHDLLIAKLHAFGFDLNSLKFVYSYLSGRKQRVKIGKAFSSLKDILYGVPQGSILGPLLFNIFICDLFIMIDDIDIANYADDNTPYACDASLDQVINKLEESTTKLFNWFSNNYLKANEDKSHFLHSHSTQTSININGVNISSSSTEKLLGIYIDRNLQFNEHVTSICNKGSQKLHALARVANFMNEDKRRAIMKAFFSSQFSYCPLVWMFHNRSLNTRINNLHERALRIVYRDNTSPFDSLLEKDNSIRIHHRNLQILATEIFKWKLGESPEIMNGIFELNNQPYNLRNKTELKRRCVKTVHYGTETISFLSPKIWNIIPKELKEITSVLKFRKEIKKWKPTGCPCRLYKTYINQVGFI